MIDLRLGNCLDTDGLPSLADRSVDLILTDPPFDARTHRAAVETGKRIEGKRSVGGALPFPALDPAMLVILAQHFVRIARRWILIFAGERQDEAWATALESAGARFVRTGLALRTNPRPQFSGDRPAPACDFLVIAHAAVEGRMRWNGRGRPGKWDAPPAWRDTGETVHPTQKSLALMRGLVSDFSEPGERILDPFAGSGSTAVACKQLGRGFVGWEVSPIYHALACGRVLQAVPLPEQAEDAGKGKGD